MVSITFDYRFDTSGFFDDADAKAALEAAGAYLGGLLNDDLDTIEAGHVLDVRNPSDRSSFVDVTLTDPIDGILIFVGAEDLGGSLGRAGPTGLNPDGDIFDARISGDFRGTGPVTNYEPWAGSVTFDPDADWSFDINGPVAGLYDFMSVAVHELVHVLGFATSDVFDSFISEGVFTGPNAMTVSAGQGIPVENDGHIEDGHNSDEDALDPTIGTGVRKLLTDNDLAMMADIGWEIDGFTAQGSTPEIVTEGDDGTVFGTVIGDTIDGLGGVDQLQGNDGDDLLLGGAGDDNLFGQGDNDTLDGGADDDYLDGGAGMDVLRSSLGEDTAFGGTGTDSFEIGDEGGTLRLADFDLATEVIILIDSGFDTAAEALAAVTKPFSNVSRLVTSGGTTVDVFHDSQSGTPLTEANFEIQNGGGTEGADTLTGTAAADLLEGLGDDDSLEGLGGNDTLDGGTGADTMVGGDGDDLYYVDDAGDSLVELTGEGDDTVEASVDVLLKTHSQFIEALTLTGSSGLTGKGNAAANTITGNSGANLLTGGGANDTLIGGDGADTLQGDSGNDSMVGGLGDDTYRVDRAGDIIVELDGEGADHVESSVDFKLKDHSQFLESLSLTGTGNINGTGNARDNTITGNAGANILNGGSGDDTLIGGDGHDTFAQNSGKDSMVGGLGDDTYNLDRAKDKILELEGEGTDYVFAGFDFDMKEYSQHIEVLELTGSADVFGKGNKQDNTVTGNSGNNLLSGGGGDDTLNGGAGNDTLNGNSGVDSMLGGAGDDTYFVDKIKDKIVELEGEGTDHVEASVAYTLKDHSQHLESLTLTGSNDIEGGGNGLANTIIGNDGNNRLRGYFGDDTLNGGAGDDRLEDSKGNDEFTGGAGADVFVMVQSFGVDTITDFEVGVTGEAVDLSATNIASYAALTGGLLTDNGGDAVISDGVGNVLTLSGIDVADLTSDHFLF